MGLSTDDSKQKSTLELFKNYKINNYDVPMPKKRTSPKGRVTFSDMKQKKHRKSLIKMKAEQSKNTLSKDRSLAQELADDKVEKLRTK